MQERVDYISSMLRVFAGAAENPVNAIQDLKKLAVSHAIWGFSKKRFRTLGVAITTAFELVMEKFSPEMKQAWTTLINGVGARIVHLFESARAGWDSVLLRGDGSKKIHTRLTLDTLNLFKSPSMTKPYDTISLSEISEVEKVTDEAYTKHTGYCFVLQLSGRQEHFCPATKAAFDEWEDHLNRRLRAWAMTTVLPLKTL